MKQILQNLRDGSIILADTPIPALPSRHILIKTSKSLISAGTERMLLEFGRGNWLSKARQQPDKVRMVLDKMRVDGLWSTMDAVRSKLGSPLPLGYCNVGRVLAVGKGITNLAPGDRVASNGRHAEVVCLPTNLCAKVPDQVEDESAAFTVLGAIALQSVRLAQPSLGESFVVIGLGLVGLLAGQILLANGCRVAGLDLDPAKTELAKKVGMEVLAGGESREVVEQGLAFSRSRGVDGVIISAATKSDQPISQAAQMSRKRGRIIMVGVTGMELSRADFYEKELTFQVSCSYGPGRYDPEYEEKGRDYPLGFVRWTEQRNFEAVLDLMASGKLKTDQLISHRMDLEDAPKAYDLLAGDQPYLGILLNYKQDEFTRNLADTIRLKDSVDTAPGQPVVGLIGAGEFAKKVIIPSLRQSEARLKYICSASGVSASQLGDGFELSTSDSQRVLEDPEVNAVIITTRHNSHASLVLKALENGKHVMVEKPLCLKEEELATIQERYAELLDQEKAPLLMVGFNRRFAGLTRSIKELLDRLSQPKSMLLTINAGAIPPEHWTQNPEVGGGRIVGEVCHFVDLLVYLAGGLPLSWTATKMGQPQNPAAPKDTLNLTLKFPDGSLGVINYFCNGHRSFPKERLEVFCGQAILQMDNFLSLRGYGWPDLKKTKLRRQDKGHRAEVEAFLQAVSQGGPAPIPIEDLFEVTRITLEAERQP